MDDLDRTYEVLKRCPFNEVVNKCYAADPYGSYTFNRLNGSGEWRVARQLEYIVINEGWTVEDFNQQLQIQFK